MTPNTFQGSRITETTKTPTPNPTNVREILRHSLNMFSSNSCFCLRSRYLTGTLFRAYPCDGPFCICITSTAIDPWPKVLMVRTELGFARCIARGLH